MTEASYPSKQCLIHRTTEKEADLNVEGNSIMILPTIKQYCKPKIPKLVMSCLVEKIKEIVNALSLYNDDQFHSPLNAAPIAEWG